MSVQPLYHCNVSSKQRSFKVFFLIPNDMSANSLTEQTGIESLSIHPFAAMQNVVSSKTAPSLSM